MWKIKGTNIVWEEARKTAERPHNLTLLIGLLSPLLAVVALTISLLSFKTSERSVRVSETNMKVGQRGYVRITGGRMLFFHPLALLELPILGDPAPAPSPPEPQERAGFHFSASLENLGNTPVRFTKLAVQLPRETGIQFDQHDLQRDLPPELGQKVRYEWSWSLEGTGQARVIQGVFKDLQEATQLSRKRGVGRRVTMGSPNFTFSLTYQDVFQEDHTVRWCWTPLIDGMSGTIYGEQCR